jgi:hypothetical protein
LGSRTAPLTADVTVEPSSYPGLAIRGSDANNCLAIWLNRGNDQVQLYQIVAGSLTQLATSSGVTNFNNGQAYALSVVLSGTSIVISVDGTEKINTTSSQFQTNTKMGPSVVLGDGALIDNILFTGASVPDAPTGLVCHGWNRTGRLDVG